ncbi:MAG: tyrosine-type recombinase/integrase [Pseudonocardiaceae bacterium]
MRPGAGGFRQGVHRRERKTARIRSRSPNPFHELVIKADLPPVRLHDLCHSAASLMLVAGVDLKVVQETRGHSSITLTSDTCTSVYPAVATAAADAVAAPVPPTVGTDVVTPSSRQGVDAQSE